MILARKITHLREALGLNKQQLAKKAGIPRSALFRYECGFQAPGPKNRGKLAVALGVDIDELQPDKRPSAISALGRGRTRVG